MFGLSASAGQNEVAVVERWPLDSGLTVRYHAWFAQKTQPKELKKLNPKATKKFSRILMLLFYKWEPSCRLLKVISFLQSKPIFQAHLSEIRRRNMNIMAKKSIQKPRYHQPRLCFGGPLYNLHSQWLHESAYEFSSYGSIFWTSAVISSWKRQHTNKYFGPSIYNLRPLNEVLFVNSKSYLN